MIVSPSGPAEQRINATLTGLNQRLAQALRNCDEGYGWALKQMGDLAKGQYPVSKDWSRRVKVTMTGPHFFSLVATENAFCGGAHPDSGQMAMVFDITTGAEVDWTTLAAKSAEPSTYSDTVMDGSTMNALVLPALRLLSVASANSDCKDVFRNPQSYLIWPDAMRETLVAQPFDLPHVVQACANEIVLTIEQARKLGFDQGLLDAIQQAHHQTVIAPER